VASRKEGLDSREITLTTQLLVQWRYFANYADEIAQARAIVREIRGGTLGLPGALNLDSGAPLLEVSPAEQD
jgi:hypothetical protein